MADRLLAATSGADQRRPGSGKTTLGEVLPARLHLLHLNRDAIYDGLRLTVELGAPE